MFDSLFNFLFKEFSWRKLGFLFSVLILLSVPLWIYESYTGFFRMARIEKAIKVAGDLAALSKNQAIGEDEQLNKIYMGILRDLDESVNQSPVGMSSGVKRGAAAALPWLITFLFYVPGLMRGNPGTINTVLGVFVVAAPFIFIGVWLPTFDDFWINYWVYPWGIFILFIFCGLIWQQSKKQST